VIKAFIREEGFYKITYADFSDLGFDLSSIKHETLKVANRGNEVAIFKSAEGPFLSGDYIVFYGEPYKSLYSNKNVYWIYQGSSEGKQMEQIKGAPNDNYPIQSRFRNVCYAENDVEYWQSIPPFEEGVDHWFWGKVSINSPGRSRDFPVLLQNIDTVSGLSSMKITLSGETDTTMNPDHHTRLYINGNVADDFTWDGQVELIREIDDISPLYFAEGENTITVEAVDDIGALVDSYYINRFQIEYWDTFVVENDFLKFSTGETDGTTFVVTGFTNDDLFVFDTTDPVNVKQVADASVEFAGDTYVLSFQDSGPEGKTYCALGSNAFQTTNRLVVDETSALKAHRDAVDYIIITHDKFYDDIQELKHYRETQGLNVEAVKIQDIYDEFSFGIKDVNAIREFLIFAYNHWHMNGHPAYVLMVGDATIDYRDDKGLFTSGNEDFLPTALYQTDPLGDTPTDNWFVCVDGDDYLPDMNIGRLCVNTSEDVQNITEKIIGYERSGLSPWNRNVVFAADNEAVFERISDELAVMLPEGIVSQTVYQSRYKSIDDATNDLIGKMNAGAVLTIYAGHGHVD